MRPFALAAILAAACSVATDPRDIAPGLDATVPAAPQGLSAAPGKTWVALRWEPVQVADVDAYVVLAGTISGALARVGDTPDPSFVVTGLAEATRYHFAVVAMDEAGNVSEPSQEASAIPAAFVPSVAFDPGPAATVNVTARLVLGFDAPMERASLPPAVTVTRAGAGPVPDCAWSWDPGDEVAVCRFAADLAPAESYTAALVAGARDRAGNPVAPASVTFATAAAPDLLAPGVAATSPGEGRDGVVPETGISVTFSEAMSEAATEGAFQLLAVAGADAAPYRGGTFAWTNGGRTVTYRPPVAFPSGALVTWSIGTGAADLAPARNPLAAPYAGSFRVADRTTVTITGDAALDGYAASSGETDDALATMLVGDWSDGTSLRGFVSFPLDALTPAPTRIVSATLSVHQAGCAGAPYTALAAPRLPFGRCSDGPARDCEDSLMARHVEVGGALDADDFSAGLLAAGVELSEAPGAGWLSRPVETLVQEDVEASRGRASFRLEFPLATNGDGVADFCWFHTSDGPSSRPTLEVTFEHP